MSLFINENYISIEDAALYLNIKPVTLRKWIKDKNVPAHKIGKLDLRGVMAISEEMLHLLRTSQ